MPVEATAIVVARLKPLQLFNLFASTTYRCCCGCRYKRTLVQHCSLCCCCSSQQLQLAVPLLLADPSP
jgi:hypothetical protein